MRFRIFYRKGAIQIINVIVMLLFISFVSRSKTDSMTSTSFVDVKENELAVMN